MLECEAERDEQEQHEDERLDVKAEEAVHLFIPPRRTRSPI